MTSPDLPAELKAALEAKLRGFSRSDAAERSASISKNYRDGGGSGTIRSETDALAYALARMPATYAAITASLNALCEIRSDFAPKTLLDIGAGPGTALWAARDCWPTIQTASMIEASADARAIGQGLGASLAGLQAQWSEGDATRPLSSAPAADLVTAAYLLDELEPMAIPTLVARLWELTGGLLLVVEPGTPAGWRRILAVRSQLIDLGAAIIAPCPHAAPCPLSAPDWCHFAQRVARSRLHRMAKGAEAPFEDEKFIYVAASRGPAADHPARVLATPRQAPGRIALKLCQPDGAAANRLVTRRDKAAYAVARRVGWGEALISDDRA